MIDIVTHYGIVESLYRARRCVVNFTRYDIFILPYMSNTLSIAGKSETLQSVHF